MNDSLIELEINSISALCDFIDKVFYIEILIKKLSKPKVIENLITITQK
jgi:hypothetical protein